LNEYGGYKHLFINKLKKLEKLEGEEVTEVERDIAKEYLKKFHDKEEETNDRPRTAKSILNIRNITSTFKNKQNQDDDVILERDEIVDDFSNKTSNNFFKKNNKISEESQPKERTEQTHDLAIDSLKEKFEQMNIKIEEVPRIIVMPKVNIKGKSDLFKIHNRQNDETSKIKKENEKLKEELEFFQIKGVFFRNFGRITKNGIGNIAASC